MRDILFRGKRIDNGEWEVANEQWCGTFHENYYGRNFEIIGNIHDNPELVKEN